MTATPNHALQRTAPVGHAACSPQSPPRRQRARPPLSLSLVSFGDSRIVHLLTATFIYFCALTISVAAGDITETVRTVLRSSPSAVRSTWTEYHDKYATNTSGEPERKDREAKWAELQAYAKAFWEIENLISPGQSISDYPGILSHGSIKWDEAGNRYVITLGLRPFDPRDGLGQFSVAFDLAGRVLSKERFRYKW